MLSIVATHQVLQCQNLLGEYRLQYELGCIHRPVKLHVLLRHGCNQVSCMRASVREDDCTGVVACRHTDNSAYSQGMLLLLCISAAQDPVISLCR